MAFIECGLWRLISYRWRRAASQIHLHPLPCTMIMIRRQYKRAWQGTHVRNRCIPKPAASAVLLLFLFCKKKTESKNNVEPRPSVFTWQNEDLIKKAIAFAGKWENIGWKKKTRGKKNWQSVHLGFTWTGAGAYEDMKSRVMHSWVKVTENSGLNPGSCILSWRGSSETTAWASGGSTGGLWGDNFRPPMQNEQIAIRVQKCLAGFVQWNNSVL